MARPLSSLAKTIRDQRAEIGVLRTEIEGLRAENCELAKNRELRERVRQLEKLLQDPLQDLFNLSLSKKKSQMLGILYRTPGVVPRERMDAAMHGADSETDLKCIDVHMVKLRRQLIPHGITIETVWGIGYCLPPESRARIEALIEKQKCVADAAIKPINGHEGDQHVASA